MQDIEYGSSAYPVREGLVAAQRTAWQRLAEPGAFLDGKRRVAVAREVRNAPSCALCKRRKESLSPFAIEGSHDTHGDLSKTEVDAIHRITTDSGRLSQEWVEELLAAGLDDCEYIEIVSIVCVVMVSDTFRRALDLPQFDLPEPVAGATSGYNAPGAKDHDGWIRLVVPEDVVPSDGKVYGGPLVSPVVKALSLVPDAKRHYWDLGEAMYLPNDEMPNFATEVRGIDRMQIEVLATRVSSLHQCVY